MREDFPEHIALRKYESFPEDAPIREEYKCVSEDEFCSQIRLTCMRATPESKWTSAYHHPALPNQSFATWKAIREVLVEV